MEQPKLKALEFAFYHCLVDDPPEHAAPALEAYGRAVAGWSRLEHHVDALIIQVNKPSYAADLYQRHPTSFTNKIDLLKKWFNRYEPLAGYREDIRYLTSKLRLLSNPKSGFPITRNLLIHSIPASYNADTETITFQNISFDGDDIRSMHVLITISQMRHFTEGVHLCNNFLSTVTSELFTPAGLAKLGTLE